MPSNDDRTPQAVGPYGRTADHSIPTLIVGGSEETRLLLRGLVRLHRHRVLAEKASADQIGAADPEDPGRVLILVADGDEDDWPHELAAARQLQPQLLVLLLVPERTPELVERARRMGVRGVLNRPFAIRDLVGSVEAVARGEDILDRPTGAPRARVGQP